MYALGVHSQALRATDSPGTERQFAQSSGTDGLSLPGLFVCFVCVCVCLFVCVFVKQFQNFNDGSN